VNGFIVSSWVSGFILTGDHNKELLISAESQETQTEASEGFPAVARSDARVLILGSLPGQRSIDAQQYYAHPQNVFWKIMGELTDAGGSYVQRCQTLLDHGIALWDVLESSVRPGSMDADIRRGSETVNDFDNFFLVHTDVIQVCFNGQKAAQLFHKLVRPGSATAEPKILVLPSTSPAYASMPYSEKLKRWRQVITSA
jgi:hypoxanthine-DNA glycosylase